MPSADNDHFGALGGAVYNESVLPVIEAGQADLVGPDHALGDFVTLVPTPGHTPGHVSVCIRDGGQEAIITGDALHSTVQCARPHWNFAHDADKGLAEISRRALLAQAAEAGSCVLGSHFALPSIGRVHGRGGVFDWEEG